MPPSDPSLPNPLNKKQQKQERLKAQAIASGDWYIWIHIFAPIFITAISFCTSALDNIPDSVFSGAGISLLLIDRRMLKLRGITPPHWGWTLLSLPYILIRCNILKKSKKAFWIAVTIIGISIALSVFTLTMQNQLYNDFKKNAPASITQMLHDPSTPQPYRDATCVTLSGLKDFIENKIICTLDNGEKISVSFLEIDDENTYLTWEPYNNTTPGEVNRNAPTSVLQLK
ncbi:hypothetical protein [Halodesulfovibrio aestuarii]|uniref:hypothetical protein n=1 Tax=Halodesulfovibrio aestuarii TaxID=126333 RepID=UPI003D329DDC